VTSAQHGAKAHGAVQMQQPYTLGCMQPVPGEREHVDGGLVEVDGHLAHGLDRVGVEDDACGAGPLGRLLHR